MKTTHCVFSLALLLASISTEAETLKCAYLDKENNVHIKHLSGLDVKITKNGNSMSLKIAPDNETVAWLVMNTWVAEDDTRPQSEELKIYKNGLIRSIKCPLFIRDHWFWQNGSQIAIDCGGRHFAGWEILYDSTSLKAIATIDQAQIPLEKRPDWSLGDN